MYSNAVQYFIKAAFVLLVVSTNAGAQSTSNDAYVVDTRGHIVRSGFGLCWRTPQWTSAKAIPDCEGDVAPKVATRSMAMAPTPVVDTDGDGVPDSRDRCPGTPAGAKVDANGCELDSDKDGVVDRLDRCPGTPAGAAVDANGCERDSDKDGVVDRLDRCRGTPAGTAVDANGCGRPEVIALKGVTFATNSATLTISSSATLDAAAATLAKRGDVRVEVAGHTDNRGSAALNQSLSQRRAEAVMRYLVGKGVNAANLSARGYGLDSPVESNNTADGRAANRRVELRIQQ